MRKAVESLILSSEPEDKQKMLQLIFNEIETKNIGAEFLTNEIFSKFEKSSKLNFITNLYLTTQTKLFALAKTNTLIDPCDDFYNIYIQVVDMKINNLFTLNLISEKEKDEYINTSKENKADIMYVSKFINLGDRTESTQRERELINALLLIIRHYQVTIESK